MGLEAGRLRKGEFASRRRGERREKCGQLAFPASPVRHLHAPNAEGLAVHGLAFTAITGAARAKSLGLSIVCQDKRCQQ